MIEIHALKKCFDFPELKPAALIVFQHGDQQKRFVAVIAVAAFLVHEVGFDDARFIPIAQFGNGNAAQLADLSNEIAPVFHGSTLLLLTNRNTSIVSKKGTEKRQ